MRYLQIDLYIPFAMNVMRHFAKDAINKSELEDVFNLLETYFSRRIVCNINTTSVDRFLASLHRDVLNHLNDDPEANYVDVLRYLFLNRTGPTGMPSDNELENAVRTNETYRQRNSFIHYILTANENGSKEIKTLHDIAEGRLKLSIEHVMPQTLTSQEWIDMLGPDYQNIHSKHLHTLSNLTLTGYNSEYSNRPFNGAPTKDKMSLEVKDRKTGAIEKVGFVYSDLRINKWIAAQEAWNEETMLKRQDQWLSDLQKVWPLPTSQYQPKSVDTSVYLLDEINLKGKGIRSIEIFGYKSSVITWSEAIDAITEAIYDKNPEFYNKLLENDWLALRIGRDNSRWMNSAEIYDTGIFIDTGNDTNTKLKIIRELCELFNVSRDQIKAELNVTKAPEDSDTAAMH